VYSKTTREFLLCTKNETNCIIYPFIYGSVLITFTVHITKQHLVNLSFLKKLVQRIIEAQWVLPS